MIEKFNPAGVHEPPGYSHVTITSAGRLAHLAGQCPLDVTGKVVGPGDYAAQTDQVIANCLAVLAAAGAKTVTSAVRGMMHKPATRAEAMSLIIG